MFGLGNRKKKEVQKPVSEEERDFISELSFNIRNPLNTICGITEITKKNLAEGCDQETLVSYIDILNDAATELSQTVDHLFESFESENHTPAEAGDIEDIDCGILDRLRVMVVEDSSVSQLIAKELLESHGAIVTICDSGSDAVKMFEQSITGTFDVIFMDINMPGMDGYEATDAIRSSSHPQASTVPIIAMTAEALSDDIQMTLKVGMNAHISKPVNTEKIVSAIKRVL